MSESPFPRWFSEALLAPFTHGAVEVDGCSIHYLTWGDPSKPPLVLVHGGAAHAMWWSILAPQLSHHYYVIAPDLSGHGDSGRRKAYSLESWATEVMAVIDVASTSAPVLVGHSMGGLVSIVVAALHGSRLAGAVIVDAPVRKPDPESDEGKGGKAFRNPKTYPDLETAVQHFRLIPEQPSEYTFIIEHIARHSVREGSAGWTWKFDPAVFARFPPKSVSHYLRDVKCRVALMRGEFSVIAPPEAGEYMYELLDRNAPIVEIPQAHHHLILDQPLAFIAALRALLADWDHSIPRRKATSADNATPNSGHEEV
ncbi:MAG: alpha/beta hydrolase [Burkholderiaceae bacterium]|jgi:pimeloyl-ACP methyl ester carboxylesterase